MEKVGGARSELRSSKESAEDELIDLTNCSGFPPHSSSSRLAINLLHGSDICFSNFFYCFIQKKLNKRMRLKVSNASRAARQWIEVSE